MKLTIIILLVLIVTSLFVGVALVAAAGGAIYPPIYRAGAPIVCDGKFVIESRSYSYKPGQRGVEHKIFCESADGQLKEDISLKAVFAAGLVYSGVIFLLFAPFAVWLPRKFGKLKAAMFEAAPDWQQVINVPPASNQRSDNITERLTKLNELRASGLITEQEYQQKRAELLRAL